LNCDINILKDSKNRNKLTIFVGAGVSKSSNLPSWSDLIKMIKSDLSINDNETDYLKIAQLYYLSCGETVYYQKIKEFFPENIEPTVIQKLIFDLKPANIITTNWDILLEKTARDNGYIYDVISKDEHLVHSELENHIIKMHADFRNNNIVFKEDDYINYKNNFPLIENYVKSILSTNTILFLGYSYSDINLKQITKWIQNNSKAMPPMFLVVFKEDKNQDKYLENFGIKTIIINKEDKSFGLDNNSNKLATFLRSLNSDKNYHSNIDNMSDLEIVNFVYKKLKPLDELNAILLNQIQSTLTNCGFSYHQFLHKRTGEVKNLIFLEFYDTILTYDIDKDIRKIYNKFREILNNFNDSYSNEIKEKINFIVSILYKANIDGYIKTDDKNSLHKTLDEFEFFIIPKYINDIEKALCNFEFHDFEVNENNIREMMKKAFLYYQKYEFLKAYKLNEKIIKICLKLQNYTQLFLAMFNQNVLLNRIKDPWYLEDTKEKTKYQLSQENMQLKPYNLDEKFYELPRNVQKILKEIKPFVNYDYLYRFASEVDDELDKKVKQKKAMETNSYMTFDTNVTRNYSKHKNLIHFILNNYMMIEQNSNFIAINKKLIKISLIRQMQEENFSLDKLELFVVVKYIAYKDLIELFNEFENFKLKINTKTLNWLTIKVFPNIVQLYYNDQTLYPHFSDELRKVLYICSLENLTVKQLEIILKEIKFLISSGKINLDIYEQINKFIDSQENINQNDLIDILEMMIDKIICSKGNIWDYQAIENNTLWSPFKHLNEQNIKYSNIKLIKSFLQEIEQFNIKQKIQLSIGFLINIYYISNEEIKELIKEFMLNINLKELNESNLENIDISNTQNFDFDGLNNYGLKISFKLFLAIHKFININNNFIEEVKQYPEKDKGNLYFLGRITGQVKYLVEEMKIKDLEELLQKLLNLIDKVNEGQKNRNRMII
jgi:hypothetical protein